MCTNVDLKSTVVASNHVLPYLFCFHSTNFNWRRPPFSTNGGDRENCCSYGCMCMYVCTCTPRARVVQPAQSRSSASTRSQALTLLLILTTIIDWKWSSTLRSRFSMVVELLAVESIKLSSLTYIITKLISLFIKVGNEIIMIRLLFIIYYAASLFMPFIFW